MITLIIFFSIIGISFNDNTKKTDPKTNLPPKINNVDINLKLSYSPWSNATVISQDIDFIGGWNLGSLGRINIATDKFGNIHVVWEDETIGEWGNDTEIMYTNYTTSKGWSNATVISDDYTHWNNGTSSSPKIAIDNNGNVYVVWEDNTKGEWGIDWEIMCANYTISNGWSNATIISDDFTHWNTDFSAKPGIIIDNNNITHVVWYDGTNGWWGNDNEIMYVNYTASGWSNVTIISDDYTRWNNGSSSVPAISIDKFGNIHVVWADTTRGIWGNDTEIMYANYTAAKGWSNATVISDDNIHWNNETSNFPDIAIGTDENMHVVWDDNTNGEWGTDLEIMYTNFTTSNGWSNATVISDDSTHWNTGGSRYPSLSIDNNNIVHVVWDDETDGLWGPDTEIMYKNYTAAGWSNITVISDMYGWNIGQSEFPDIATDSNNNTHVVWWDGTDGIWGYDYEVMYANYTSMIWSNPIVISDKVGWLTQVNDGDSLYPCVTKDIFGNIHAVWQDDTNDTWHQWDNDIEIMYANYSISNGWSNAIVISDNWSGWNDGDSTHPSIATDIFGNIHVVWADGTWSPSEWGYDIEIMYVNYTLNKGWSNATVISDDYTKWNVGNSTYPSIATDISGVVHVIWQDETNGWWGTDTEILYANFTAANGWSNATPISDDYTHWNTGESKYPSIIADKNGNLHAVWDDDTNGIWGTDTEIMYANYTLLSGWSNATVVSDDSIHWNTGESRHPDIAADKEGNIHVAWDDDTPGQWGADLEIMYTNYTTSNGWSNATVISDDNSKWNIYWSIYPRIDTDNNSNAHIVWFDYTQGEWGIDVEIMYANNIYSKWSNATVISDDWTKWNTGDSWYPDIVVDNKTKVHVVWFDQTPGMWGMDAEIFYSSLLYDLEEPNIISVSRDPLSPGNLDNVNITAHITDNIGLDKILINSNHTGAPLNYSMNNISGNNTDGYWSYTILALPINTTVIYSIYTNDTFNNSDFEGPYQYTVRDNEPPNIISVTKEPLNPDNFDVVNVTAQITENVGIGIVLINSNHSGSSINYSMNLLSGDNQNGYWNYTIPAYPIDTVIVYSIWANDTSNNSAIDGPFQYTVRDIENPEIVTVSREPNDPTYTVTVNITAYITDNTGIDTVLINSNHTGTMTNYTMEQLSGNNRGGYWNYTIPASPIGTIVNYSIYANDTYLNYATAGPYQYIIPDTINPNIVTVWRTPINPGNLDAVNITIHATDNVRINLVLLNSNHTGITDNYTMVRYSGDNQDGYWNYTIPACAAEITILYSIYVLDENNNSDITGPYQYTIYDNEIPNIITISKIPNQPGSQDSINITVHISDNVGIHTVIITSNHTGTLMNYTMNFLSGTNKNGYWNFTIPATPSGTLINYSIWVNDTSGNNASTLYYGITVIDIIYPDLIPLLIASAISQGSNSFIGLLLSSLGFVIIGIIISIFIVSVILITKKRSKSKRKDSSKKIGSQLPWVGNT